MPEEMLKGIILDFNGTCFLDHDLNDYAWHKTFSAITHKTSLEDYQYFLGNNQDALNKDADYLKAIFDSVNLKYDDKKIEEFTIYKETLYKNEAIRQNRNKLMKGLDSFLDYLVKNNTLYTIASMAPKINFDFYLDYLNLKKWFSYENIVHDDTKYKNKNPMYLDACRIMNVDIKEALLFEDSPRVIKKSLETGIENIVYVNSKDIDFNIKEIKQTINDFNEFDYNLISKVK